MIFRRSLAGLAAIVAAPVAALETYVIEPVHSQPVFEARHVGFSFQYGSFGKLAGKVTLDRVAKKGAVDIAIDPASIRSFSPALDNVLRSERFFNVARYPTITFRSSNVVFDNDKVTRVDGELTMLGVTKPVSLTLVNFVCGESPFNRRPMCGADATARIKRSEWGMTDGLAIGSPADEVRLMLPIEAYRE